MPATKDSHQELVEHLFLADNDFPQFLAEPFMCGAELFNSLDAKLPAVPVDPERLLSLAEKWNLAGPTRRLVDAMAG